MNICLRNQELLILKLVYITYNNKINAVFESDLKALKSFCGSRIKKKIMEFSELLREY